MAASELIPVSHLRLGWETGADEEEEEDAVTAVCLRAPSETVVSAESTIGPTMPLRRCAAETGRV